MLLSIVACSKANTATVNDIKFEMPEGYTLSQVLGGNLASNEFEGRDQNGNSVFSIGFENFPFSSLSYTGTFEEWLENQLSLPLQREGAQKVTYGDFTGCKLEGLTSREGWLTIMVFALKGENIVGYIVAYDAAQQSVVDSILAELTK